MWDEIKQKIRQLLGFDDVAGTSGRYEVYAIRLDVHYGEGSPALTDNGTIYIGSGVFPTRKEEHIKVARRKVKTRYGAGKLSHKEKILLWAEDNNVRIFYDTLWRTDNREEAYCVERRFIEHYGIERLTNEAYGHCNEKALHTSQKKEEFCHGCGVVLEVSVNIPARRFAKKDYICTACATKRGKVWRANNPGARQTEYTKRLTRSKENSLCVQCGSPTGLPGKLLCGPCAQKNRTNATRYYNKKVGKSVAPVTVSIETSQ